MAISKCVLCDKKEAVFHISTCRFVRHDNGDIVRKNSGGRVCPACLVDHLTAIPNAHHFAYRLDAPYQPDGLNYDDGLVLSVLACARYRRQTIKEFMARAGRLVEWYGWEELG